VAPIKVSTLWSRATVMGTISLPAGRAARAVHGARAGQLRGANRPGRCSVWTSSHYETTDGIAAQAG
jgi:hypothetical protein